MTAVGDARKPAREAQAPATAPIPAPVDSGAIGRLTEAERGALAEGFLAWWVSLEASDYEDMIREAGQEDAEVYADAISPVVANLVREHTDRALAEVEQERDEIAGRLSGLLCELTGGLLSKTGYSVRDMVTAIESEFDKVARQEVDDALAEVEQRLAKAWDEGYEKALRAIDRGMTPYEGMANPYRAARQEQGRA